MVDDSTCSINTTNTYTRIIAVIHKAAGHCTFTVRVGKTVRPFIWRILDSQWIVVYEKRIDAPWPWCIMILLII